MKYLIVEDEVPAQRLIADLVGELRPDWEQAGCLDSVDAAVEWFRSNPQPEIVFMDIQLSDGLSFDIFKHVNVEGMIIFTTAYDQYALRAFQVNSIDYLLKPISKKKLAEALKKYERHHKHMWQEHNKALDIEQLVRALSKPKPRYRSRFLVEQGETFVPVPVADIAFLFSRHKITSAVSFEGKRYVLDLPLDKLEDQLDPEMFFRAGRGFIVNIEAVAKVHTFFNGKLILETAPTHDEKTTISREKARAFKQWLDR
ncbi:MAG: response regulator transcription factor [bacterium]|nr:response regulator transcription factor [bacterium]